MAHSQPVEAPATLTVIRYPDPATEAHGYGPEHAYPELVLCSIVGPSSLLLWRRLARIARHADANPVSVDTVDLLASIGLGAHLGKNSPGARTIARMLSFDMARQAGRAGQLLAVRTALAPVAEPRLGRLPASARRYHAQIHPAQVHPAAVPDRRPAPTAPLAPGLFRLGKLHATPTATRAMANTGTDPHALIERHRHGDWGDVTLHDALANNAAIEDGGPIGSLYALDATHTVTITTDATRTATTIAAPAES